MVDHQAEASGVIRRLFKHLLSALLVFCVAQGLMLHWADSQLDGQIAMRLKNHLLLNLDSSLFSDQDTATNDIQAIGHVGVQLNRVLGELIHFRWFAVYSSCEMTLGAIDGVSISVPESDFEPLVFTVAVNGLPRSVSIYRHCTLNPLASGCLFILILALWAVIGLLLPAPLSALQRHWYERLLEAGYSDQQAYSALVSFSDSQLEMSSTQESCFYYLHQAEMRNAFAVLTSLQLPALKALPVDAEPWLILGLEQEPQDLGRALQLAMHSPEIEVDLRDCRLRVHGVEVHCTKTPLFYYALYAREKLRGEGWITNPPTNRPDVDKGAELAEIMWQYGGHAKAISELEEKGIKAKTLDQNRSKIKDDITAALGDRLAAPYLFIGEKDPKTGRMRYRLELAAGMIRLIQ